MDFMRQAGLVDQEKIKDAKVTLVGAGGIGSLTACFLAKMGIENLSVFDFDYVEPHNIPNQMYPRSSVGQPKVQALAGHLQYMEEVDIETFEKRFEEEDPVNEIVVMAVDSMKARQEIWDAIKCNPDVEFVVDGRMGGWTCICLALDLTKADDIEYYEDKMLFPDEEADPLPCTERATIFNTGAIGSMISDRIAKKVSGFKVARHIAYDIKTSTFLKMNEE